MTRRIESFGSVWEIDDDLSRYRRWPKEEKPRENGWGGPDAGALEDLVWHDMTAWGAHPVLHRLVIGLADEPDHVATAPLSDATWLTLLAEGRVFGNTDANPRAERES